MKLFTLLFTLLLCSSAYASGERLIGTWKSNREKTLENLRQVPNLSEGQRNKLTPLFGKISTTYDGKRGITKLNGESFEEPYTVISDTPQAIVIESLDAMTKKKEKVTLRFSGKDEFCVDVVQVPGLAECFARQK